MIEAAVLLWSAGIYLPETWHGIPENGTVYRTAMAASHVVRNFIEPGTARDILAPRTG